MIQRRHVIYVEGYDPQGAEGYYKLFDRSRQRFLKIWPVSLNVGELTIDSEDFAHWNIEASGPNWQVATRYDFLRQEQMIRANMAAPMWRQIPRTLWWIVNFLYTGALARVYFANWRYGLALSYFQGLLLLWLVAAGCSGWLAAWLMTWLFGAATPIAAVVGVAAAIGGFMALRPFADRLRVVQINNHWPYLLEYAYGQRSCFDRAIEAGARRLVEVARANDADEIVVIGHSGGGVTAPAIVARALEFDPDIGRHGPKLVLLTPGSLMPGIGLHPGAAKIRKVIERIAVEPSILWIDVQARKDVLNFFGFDPVGGLGIDVGARRCNPLVWIVRFRDMLAPAFYNKLRNNFFRMHYQFIMANDARAPYDYTMIVSGPAPVERWARGGWETLAEFSQDARYLPAPPASA